MKINVVVRTNGILYQNTMDSSDVENIVNNVKFINNDKLHISNLISLLESEDDTTIKSIHPIVGGIIVIDLDNNVIVNYQNEFTPGTMFHNKVNKDLLDELYEEGKILLDEIDFMIDIRPFVHENYDARYPSEGELARNKIQQLGIYMGVSDHFYWGFWTGTLLTDT